MSNKRKWNQNTLRNPAKRMKMQHPFFHTQNQFRMQNNPYECGTEMFTDNQAVFCLHQLRSNVIFDLEQTFFTDFESFVVMSVVVSII
jgi:hypothetical protein